MRCAARMRSRSACICSGETIVVSGLFSSDIRNTYLELGTHTCEDPPENLHTDVEHLRYRADSIPTKTQAEILIDSLNEGGRIVRRARVDDC